MSQPSTLVEIAGGRLVPANPDAAVLVIIDAQNEYVTGRLPLAGVDAAIAHAAEVLVHARRAGIPVIHVVHHSPPGGPLFDLSTPAAEIVPALAPAEGERIVTKTLPNAFAGTTLATDLAAIARQSGRGELILIGFMTHMCVSATARAALDLGLPTTIVAAATATRDLPDPLGGVVAAEIVHRTALAELADRFAAVVPDADALFGRA